VTSASWTRIRCGLDPSGSASLELPGSVAFVAVGRNSVVDGSLGRDSSAVERAESISLAPCDYPQDLSATCD